MPGCFCFPILRSLQYQTDAGVNGVLTHFTFTPEGSIKGAISVEERVGSFAYYTQAIAIGKKITSDFKSAIKKDAALTSDVNFVAAQSAQLLSPTVETNLTVAADLATEAADLGLLGFTKLAGDISALAGIADEWQTPEFFMERVTACSKSAPLRSPVALT